MTDETRQTVGTHTISREVSSDHARDMNGVWRIRCPAQVLEERLQDATAALRASEAARLELSKDYRHVLGQLWRANAGIQRRDR